MADDTIVLENAVFTALAAPRNLARDLTALFYDADGTGGAAATRK